MLCLAHGADPTVRVPKVKGKMLTKHLVGLPNQGVKFAQGKAVELPKDEQAVTIAEGEQGWGPWAEGPRGVRFFCRGCQDPGQEA